MERATSPPSSGIGRQALAEGWADVARLLTLYPESNSRVLRAIAAFREALRSSFRPTVARVEVAFSAEAVWVDGEAFPLVTGSNLAWLKQRLDRSDLSGAIFSDGVDEAALVRFTKRLLELYTRRNMDLEFQELWPETYEGIALLERHFDGAFAGLAEGPEGPAGPLIKGRTRKQAKGLCETLALDARIRERIDRVRAAMPAPDPNASELAGLDLLAEIVDLLPVEGLKDPAKAAEMTDKALAALEEALGERGGPADAVAGEGDAGFRRLLSVISRSHFTAFEAALGAERAASAAAAQVDPAAKSPRLRKSDEAISDDLGALLADMERLGAPLALPCSEDLEDPAEELGIFLHYLVTRDGVGTLPRFRETFARLLQVSGDVGTGILRTYLETSRAARLRGRHLHAGLATWLRRNGHRDQLERCGVLDAAWACREFPKGFLDYLGTLDLDDAQDRAELDGVCKRIGPHRFRRAGDLLSGASDFLTGDWPQRLFGLTLRSIGPLLRQIFEKDPQRFRDDFARFLRATAIFRPDIAILDLASRTPFLLTTYLSALADNETEKLADQREMVLHSFVGAVEGDPRKLEQYLKGIQLLAEFDTPQTEAYLERLVGERAYVFLRKHPRRVREAAANSLGMIAARRCPKRV